MKNKNLPFAIGKHYENWEMNLEILDIERIKGYDSYIYIREILIFGIKPRSVELIFHWDILVAIILDFEELDFPKVEKLTQIGYIKVNHYFYISENHIDTQIYKSLLC